MADHPTAVKPAPVTVASPRLRQALQAVGGYAASIGGLVLVWYLMALALPPTVLPSPINTGRALLTTMSTGVLWPHFADSMTRVGLSFFFAMLLGVGIGAVLGLWAWAERLFALWVMVALTIPSLCYVVIAFMWLGLNERGAVLAITGAVFPAIAINIWSGVKNIDSKLVLLARAYRLSGWERLWRVVLPQILPYVVAAARFGLGIVWKVTVLVELLGRGTGIGYQLSYWWQLYDMEQVFAWTLFFTVVMLVIELAILKPIEDLLFRWRPRVQA